jgi:hypothetical protein
MGYESFSSLVVVLLVLVLASVSTKKEPDEGRE